MASDSLNHENIKTLEPKNNRKKNNYKENLRNKMDEFVSLVYRLTEKFPKVEMFSSVTQWRRAALSIILNYTEGYARRKKLVQLNFFEISYGSLKEAKYLLYFSKTRNYISIEEYNKGLKISEEIGAMLWHEISSIEKSLKT